MQKAELKACVVTGCGANSETCPFLFFLKVPQNPERRIDWCDAMGVPSRKGRLYCCTRHFDIPGDFDGDSSADKSSGIRLKLRSDVLPHKGIPFQNDVKNIYLIFDYYKSAGKIEKNYKHLMPVMETDLKIHVPVYASQATLDRAYDIITDQITEYFQSDKPKSRYQLVQLLREKRDAISQIVNEKIPRGTLQGSIWLKTIQPFLQYDAYGSLDLPIDHKQLEQVYFECDTKQLKLFFRPPKSTLPAKAETIDPKDLFFTPGIRINLSLPFFEISREIVSNSEKYIVNASSALKESEMKPNGLEKFQKVDKPYRLKCSKVGQNVTLEYLDILVNLFENYEFMMSQSQRSTLIFLLQQVRKELTEYEMKEIQITYGCYLSPYKYYRIINETVKPDARDEDYYMYVKEVINPELNFQFINAIDTESGSIEKIEQFFRPILGYVNEDSDFTDSEPYLKFADQLKKAIVYTCQECSMTFDSVLAHLSIQEHRFCGVKKWKCTNCKQSFRENEIAGNMWMHKCS